MTDSHDAYWAAVSRNQVTDEVFDHERHCRECSDLRWALEETRRVESADVPPVPPDLAEEVRQSLGVTSLAGPVHRRRRRSRVPALAILIAVSLVAGVLALRGGAGIPAFADVALTEDCTPLLSERRPDQVVVAAVWARQERERFRRTLDRFTEMSGIQVEFASRDPDADRDLGGTLRSLADGGCAPDVALLPQPGLLQDLARDGRLQAVDAVAGDLVDQNYAPVWRKLATGDDDDKLYGVWFKAANKSMIWYNARAFTRAGVRPPQDWDGLMKVAGALAAKNITPFSVAAANDAGWTLTDWFENIYLQTAGPERYDQLTRHDIGWDDPTVVYALELMAGILRPEWVAAGAARTSYEKSVRQVFGDLDDPAAAMVFEADFVASELPDTAVIGQDARFFPFPRIDGDMSSTVAGSAGQAAHGEVGGDVAVLMRDRDEARELLRFLAMPEAAEPWAEQGGFLSPNQKLDRSDYPDAATWDAAKALAGAATVRFDLSDLQHAEFGSTPGKGMWRILRDFVTKRPTAAATAERLERAYCQTAPADRAASCRR